MEQYWLSVVIPSHNGERWLAAALQSLVDQNEPGIEVIVIDSSTDDASLRIVYSFANELAIRAERRLDLLSWMAKVNFAAEQAASDRICMLHQDDLWLPNRSVRLRKWLSTQPDGVMYLHASYIVDEFGRRLGTWRCPFPDGSAPVPTDMFVERLLVQNFVAIPAPTMRRDAFLKVGGLDDTLWYTADWDLYLKIAATGNVYYSSDILTCFRIHGNSLTVLGSRNLEDFREQHEIVQTRYIEHIAPKTRKATRRLSATSTDVNVALAAANNGKPVELITAALSILALGPRLMTKYFRYSRIIERLMPRLRARFAGGF
jgi:glycosyltransferase involved in cell wall biosynthesis